MRQHWHFDSQYFYTCLVGLAGFKHAYTVNLDSVKIIQLDPIRNIPVGRRISRRPRKNFGLAAVDFTKPPAAGDKKKFG